MGIWGIPEIVFGMKGILRASTGGTVKHHTWQYKLDRSAIDNAAGRSMIK